MACEESQVVAKEFRALGHEAYSSDLQECSGGHPEYHLGVDASELLKIKWDLVIAHPPCTYLTNASSMRLRVNGVIDEERMEKARMAKEFFMRFYETDCPRIAIENPVPGRIHELPPYTQIIEPYMFGDPWKKRTCLWLKGLPKLIPTNPVEPLGLWVGATSSRRDEKVHSRYALASIRDSKKRSKTFQGIGRAMAEQWGACA